MAAEPRQILARLLRTQRIAALGTLRDGAPFVSMVLFAPSPDCTSLFIHISRLAQHTRDILQDNRVSLMLAETDSGAGDPQQLARVSIQGTAVEIPVTDTDHAGCKSIYLTKYPHAAFNFQFGDFNLFRIQVISARLVAGFGEIFDLTAEDFRKGAR
jgi:heme oxygenase (biliverdin-IX-beta and delta-forming)